MVSKFQTSADISIITNGNAFFKKGPFYGDKVENYRDDWNNLPKYFYVPESVTKLYFSVNNACPYNNSCVTPVEIQNAFSITNNTGQAVEVKISSQDSSLYKIEVPSINAGSFWEVPKMREYNLCFANISNIEVYAEKNPCSYMDFTAAVTSNNVDCYTKLTTDIGDVSGLQWEIHDGLRSFNYSKVKTVDLPAVLSAHAVITLRNGSCSVTKISGEIKGYISSFSVCASASQPHQDNKFVVYPNPSNGVFNFKKNNSSLIFEEVKIYDAHGKMISRLNSTGTVDLSDVPAGIYFFKGKRDNDITTGKLIKN